MKLALVGSALLLGAALANGVQAGADGIAPPLCTDEGRQLPGEREPGRRYFMEEAEAEPGVDYSLLAVEPPDDRHYFIQSPPLPDMRERLCDLGWLREFVPGAPLEWFDFER